jgi:hypothetical protein
MHEEIRTNRFSRFGAKHHFLCPYKAQNPAFYSFITNIPNIVLSFYIFFTSTVRMSNIFKAKKGFFDSGEGISHSNKCYINTYLYILRVFTHAMPNRTHVFFSFQGFFTRLAFVAPFLEFTIVYVNFFTVGL